ncbi:hypothetical protein [Sphingomonas soli]|uniref:hypothetical protein n=1 Tax=Sphingomonas soli TaxID=266127 RepID=UPI0008358CF7|nr:hypothetical protein [Sphingomonas soli]
MRKLLIAIIFLLPPLSANAQWHKAVSDHFVIYAEGDEAWLRNYAEELERFDRGIRSFRNLPDSPAGTANKVTLFVVEPSNLSRLAGSRMGNLARATESGSVAFLPRTSNDPEATRRPLFHAYAHHVYAVAWPNVTIPGWLQEGLAEFHGTTEFRPDGSIVLGRELGARMRALNPADREPIIKMLNLQRQEPGERIFTTGGWLLTHLLTFSPGRENQIGAYIAAINSGKSLSEAAQVFGSMDKLGADLIKYRRGTGLKAVVVPASDLKSGPVTVHALTLGEAAMIDVRMESQGPGDEKAAQALYARAKAAAAPYADDADAQLVLAKAAYDAKDFAATEAAADRVIATDPKLPGGYAYKAMAMTARAQAEKDKSAPRWAAIRKVLADGKRLNPDNPQLLMLFYRSFGDSGIPLNQPAKQALYHAVAVAPDVRTIRVAAAAQLIEDGSGEEAKIVLRPLAFDPHNAKSGEQAQSAIDLIDKGDLPGAGKALASAAHKNENDEPQAERRR